MSMTCRVQISLKLDEGKADVIREALKPDNVDFPPGLTMEMTTQDGTAVIEIACPDNISRVIGTVDEVLAHVQVALDVVE